MISKTSPAISVLKKNKKTHYDLYDFQDIPDHIQVIIISTWIELFSGIASHIMHTSC